MLIAGFDAGQTHTRCRLQRWLCNPEPGADAGAGPIVGEGEGTRGYLPLERTQTHAEQAVRLRPL